jgi:hypothetical protein
MKTQTMPKPVKAKLSFGQRERLRLRRDFEPLVEYSFARPLCQSANVLTFRFPMPPNKANGRGAWRVDYSLRELFFEQCDYLAEHRFLPPSPPVPFERATISAELFLKREMDDDNAMARLKHISDWLVKRGYIVDDKRKCLTWDGIPIQSKTGGTVQRVGVVLTRSVTA